MIVPDSYYQAICTAWDAPWNTDVQIFWQSWQRREGGSARWNAINTEWKLPGSTFYNHTSENEGVQNYLSQPQGVQATIESLDQAYYENIKAGIISGKPWDTMAEMSNDFLTWSGGGYLNLTDPRSPTDMLSNADIQAILTAFDNCADLLAKGTPSPGSKFIDEIAKRTITFEKLPVT